MRRVISLIAVLFGFASDLGQFLRSAFQSRTALVAENLFLRKQLAFYREHKVRPRRMTDVARLSLVYCPGYSTGRRLSWSSNPTPSSAGIVKGSSCSGAGSLALAGQRYPRRFAN